MGPIGLEWLAARLAGALTHLFKLTMGSDSAVPKGGALSPVCAKWHTS